MKLPRPSPLLIAALIMAASGFIVLIIPARFLTMAETADFLAYWSALFGITGSLAGVQNESSRAMATQQTPGDDSGRGGAPILAICVAVGLTLGLLAALTGIGWLPGIIGPGSNLTLGLFLIALAVAGYAGHNAAVGSFLGGGDSGGAALLITVEAVARFVLFVAVAALGWGIGGFWLATALPMTLWVVTLAATGRLRGVAALRARESSGAFTRNLVLAILAGACTSILVNGYPAVLRATTDESLAAATAPAAYAISLTRAPLLVPIISFQGAIVAFFVRQQHRVGAALAQALAIVWGLGLTVALGMGLLGPWVMRLLYGAEYDLPGLFMALLAVGAGMTATLVVAASIAMARGRHALFLSAWVVATVVSVGLLLLPTDLHTRVVLSLVIGPFTGALVALAALAGAARRRGPLPGSPTGDEPETGQLAG